MHWKERDKRDRKNIEYMISTGELKWEDLT